MAQNTTLNLVANTWTQLTDTNVTAMRIANFGQYPIWLQATVGETPPSNTNGAIPLNPGQMITTATTVAQLWPGVAGANRIYAMSPVVAKVSVSNA